MVKRTNNSNKGAATVTLDSVNSVWDTLRLEQWKTIAESKLPENRWYAKTPSTLWGCCISHDDKTPSFVIDTGRHFAHCYGCGYHISDPVQLAAALLDLNYSDAVVELVNTYGPFRGVSTASLEKVAAFQRLSQAKDAIAWSVKSELLDALVSYESGEIEDGPYEYALRAIKYLLQRGIPLSTLHLLPMGIIPPPGKLFQRLRMYATKKDLDVVADAQEFFKSAVPIGPAQTGSRLGWLAFINYVDHNSIGSFKLREPFSGGDKKIFYVNDTQSPVGFFGLGIPSVSGALTSVSGDSTDIFVVEGEFDALAILCPQLESGTVTTPVVSAGGNTILSLDGLQRAGYDTAKYIPDWDEMGAKVLFNKLPHTTRIRVTVFKPTEVFTHAGKDVHNIYMAMGAGTLLKELSDEEHYQSLPDWALGQIAVALPSDADKRTQAEVAGRFLSVMNNDFDKRSLVKTAASAFNIPEDLLRHQASPNTEDGFIEAMTRFVGAKYFFMYQELTGRGRSIVAWNHDLKATVSFDLAKSQQIEAVMKGDLGPVVDWVEDSVGVPPKFKLWVDDDTGKVHSPPDRLSRLKYYCNILANDVLPRLVQRTGIKPREEMTIAGQGIHIPNKSTVYVVNGNHMYKREAEGDRYNWVELEAPQDGDYLFTPEPGRAWSTAINSVDDLNNEEPTPIGEHMKELESVIDIGFRFRGHTMECTYLAAFIIAAPLGEMFEHIPWIFIHGPTNTGKSTLTQLLSSQSVKQRSITLLEHSLSLDNFTVAGVKHLMKGSSLSLILDEFEVGIDGNTHDPKNYQSRNTLELLRGGISQGSRVTMGSQSGKSVSFTLRFPFVASGIHAFHKREDINRVNIIEMAVRDQGLGKIKVTTPTQLIESSVGVDKLRELREKSTRISLQQIDALREAYLSIKKEYATGSYTAPGTQSRTREQLLPILAVLKLAGRDYHTFSYDYTKAKTEQLAETMQNFEFESIWERLLHTNAITLPSEDIHQSYTLAQIIGDASLLPQLNLTDCGVYYLPEGDYLAVVWPTALNGPLFKSTIYARGGRASILRSFMEQDARVLTNTAPHETKQIILGDLRMYAGIVSWRDITVISCSVFRGAVMEPRITQFDNSTPDQKHALLLEAIGFGEIDEDNM